MLSISGLLLAAEITKDEMGYLGMLLTEHHCNFVQIYPDESVAEDALLDPHTWPYTAVSDSAYIIAILSPDLLIKCS